MAGACSRPSWAIGGGHEGQCSVQILDRTRPIHTTSPSPLVLDTHVTSWLPDPAGTPDSCQATAGAPESWAGRLGLPCSLAPAPQRHHRGLSGATLSSAVTKSKCPSYVGVTGILLQETKHVFKIVTKEDRLKGG